MKTELITEKGIIHIGTRIRIIHLNNGSSSIDDSDYDGREGVVKIIDSMNQMHGTWGGLAVLETDEFEILPENSVQTQKEI